MQPAALVSAFEIVLPMHLWPPVGSASMADCWIGYSSGRAAVWPALVTVWLAVQHAATPAIAVNPRPSNQHHGHGSDGTSIHWHACISCCNPVRDIPAAPAKWHMERWWSFSPFSVSEYSNR